MHTLAHRLGIASSRLTRTPPLRGAVWITCAALAVWVAATWLVPVADPQLRIAAVVFAAMPMLGVYPILAQKHGHEETTAAALLVTTIASFFTLSALLWGLKS